MAIISPQAGQRVSFFVGFMSGLFVFSFGPPSLKSYGAASPPSLRLARQPHFALGNSFTTGCGEVQGQSLVPKRAPKYF